jgi:hypothetical protein
MMEMGMVYNIRMVPIGGYNGRQRERQQMFDRRRRERHQRQRIEARFRRLENQALEPEPENKPMLPETQPTLPIGARRRTRRRKNHKRKTHKR